MVNWLHELFELPFWLIDFQMFHGTTGTFLLVFYFIHDILDHEFGKILIL
nr:MAG TPA: hypothetical protein [Bacteriophage sp.]